MKQNITLAVEKPLLKRARAIAAQRGKSISALLADELEKIADREAAYDKAMARALAFLKSPVHLGGTGLSDRERLHARKRIR
jgi:hypothetical protein